jgi:hypothetical protein
MAQKLLSNKLQQKLHIGLIVLCSFFGMQVEAQSVLLPGDVVIVSANADAQSFDFISLIDIERGTSVYFSDGRWDRSESLLDGNELKLIFNESISAGANVHINNEDDPRFSKSGALNFEGDTHRIFVYQKEEAVHRFIFGIGWGKGHIWNTEAQSSEGSDIPLSLRENPHALLSLGEEQNQQYYLRNGASGTRNMLLSLVGDPENWRGNNQNSFANFGTSFNLLSPPVIQFDKSISEINEGDSTAVLNIAVYEHDGSRIFVDVEFDSLRSIVDKADLNGFSTKRINFTGLVGDFTYAVEIPILDDEVYEGRETGIFTLNNLSAGSYGDFLTHNLLIEDNEQPEIIISRVANSNERTGFIEIQNQEDGVVSLEGWMLSGNSLTYEFPKNAVLLPNETLRWVDAFGLESIDKEDKVFSSESRRRMLNKDGGVLTLQNITGRIIHQVSYSKVRNTEGRESRRKDLAVRELDQNIQSGNLLNEMSQNITALRIQNPGWKFLSGGNELNTEFSGKAFYSWNEEMQRFQALSGVPAKEQVVLGFFDTEEMESLSSYVSLSKNKKAPVEELSFTVSATDINRNETIDGIEGLNLVFNDLDRSISVPVFLGLIENEYPELPISEHIYSVRQNASGAIEFKKLEVEESIAPKASFLIMLESETPATSLTLNKNDFKENLSVRDVRAETDRGLFELTLKTPYEEEEMQLYFTDGANTGRSKDLNSYPELYLPDQPYLNFSFKAGEEFYNQLILFSGIERQVQLPIHFSSFEAGSFTFSVTKWEQVPPEWDIILIDQKTNKEYNLRRNFSVTIEHDFKKMISFGEEVNRFSTIQYRDDERFAVKISPSKISAQHEEALNDKPRQVELHQNYPNPFNPVTTISFYLPKSEEVRLSVFNIVGQPVAVIVDGTLSAGQQQFEWDATDKPSGMYIYQLEVGNSVMTRKMTLVK